MKRFVALLRLVLALSLVPAGPMGARGASAGGAGHAVVLCSGAVARIAADGTLVPPGDEEHAGAHDCLACQIVKAPAEAPAVVRAPGRCRAPHPAAAGRTRGARPLQAAARDPPATV